MQATSWPSTSYSSCLAGARLVGRRMSATDSTERYGLVLMAHDIRCRRPSLTANATTSPISCTLRQHHFSQQRDSINAKTVPLHKPVVCIEELTAPDVMPCRSLCPTQLRNPPIFAVRDGTAPPAVTRPVGNDIRRWRGFFQHGRCSTILCASFPFYCLTFVIVIQYTIGTLPQSS